MLTLTLSNGHTLTMADIERAESTFRDVVFDQEGNAISPGHHVRIDLHDGAPIELDGDEANEFKNWFDNPRQK